MRGSIIILAGLVPGISPSTAAWAQQTADRPSRYILDYPAADRFCPPVRTFFRQVQRTIERVGGRTIRHPLNGGYGLPIRRKLYGKNLIHLGADVGWYRVGAPVFAVANGAVRISRGPLESNRGGKRQRSPGGLAWGNLIVIEHRLPDGTYISTIYGHLGNDRAVQAGDVVRAGQKIGTIGEQNRLINGGYQPHLHFGIVKRRIGEKGSLLYSDDVNGQSVTLEVRRVTEDYVQLDEAHELPDNLMVLIGSRLVSVEEHEGIRRIPSSVLWNHAGLNFPLQGYGLSTAQWHDPVAFLTEHHAHTNPAPFLPAARPRTRQKRAPGDRPNDPSATVPEDVPSSQPRCWRGHDGNTLIEGRFVNLHDSILTVQTGRDAQHKLPLEDLAADERQFAKDELVRRRQATIDFLAKYGGHVRRDGTAPASSVVSVGLPHRFFTAAHIDDLAIFPHLTSLHLRNVALRNADLAVLEELPELETLYLHNCGHISDRGLVHFAQLRNLEDVRITHSRIRGQGLSHLAALPRLRSVILVGSQISNRALDELRSCRHVESLTVQGGRITGNGLRHLGEMTQLRQLHLTAPRARTVDLSHFQELKELRGLVLTDTPVRDGALVALNELLQLEALLLGGTKITDKGLQHLRSLTNLTKLDLRGTQVTDGGLKELEHFESLKWINLFDTHATLDGIKRLQAALPEAEIWHRGQQ